MTEFLKEVLKEAQKSNMSPKDRMHHLKRGYQKKRQIGQSECIYRSTPSLHLKDSNMKCIFVSSGLPQSRFHFMKKVSDQDDELESQDEDESIDGTDADGKDFWNIEGRSGLFEKGLSIHDKYKARPMPELQDLTLAQFATSYVQLSKPPSDKVIWNGNVSEMTGAILNLKDDKRLPKYIELSTKRIIFMRLRTYPAILRMHASKKKAGHEQFFAEMQMFHPWTDEEDLHPGSPTECQKMFEDVRGDIKDIRQKMFPFSKVCEDALNTLQEEGNESRPTHIFDTLDAAAAQDNLDAQEEEEEMIVGPETDFDHWIDDVDKNVKDESKYKALTLASEEQLLILARNLVPEQLMVLHEVVKYCKRTQLAYKSNYTSPQPLRLIVHGGQGVGKSRTIQTCAQHAEKILRQAGNHPNLPRVLLLGPTGMSASLIGK